MITIKNFKLKTLVLYIIKLNFTYVLRRNPEKTIKNLLFRYIYFYFFYYNVFKFKIP